jgi:hypothetical protein
LAALEAERQRRIQAGTLSQRPKLVVVPADGKTTLEGETLRAAQQREVYRYLADHPNAPKSINAYDWIVYEIVYPTPTVEANPYAPDHADAVDVTPRSPPPSPPMRQPRSLPPAPGAGALSADPARMNIPARIHDAEQRRTRNFNDDTWGDPTGWPIRYPRGNRNGW